MPHRDEKAARSPNLLFVLVDQMRYHAMGPAGNEQVITPNLDRLAAEGVCCTHAVSNIPVCTPARACLLTGRYPMGHTVLVNNSMLPTDMPSLGTCLKQEGYATGYIGKWHLAGEGYIGATRFNHGVNGYIPPGDMRHGFDFWAVHHCSHHYRDATMFRDDPTPIALPGWEPDRQTDLAVEFIEQQAAAAQEQPFALVVSWGTPHTPFDAPQEDRALYDPDSLVLRENVAIPETGWPHPDARIPQGCDADPERALRIWTANYYAAVTNIDRNLGRLLDTLDQLNLADDTVVVFTSDHGEMLGSHGQLHKVQPWDESIRVPFLLRYPGRVSGGRRVNSPFNEADVLPTLFGLMAVDVPEGVEGEDLSDVFLGAPEPPDRSAFLLWPCSAVTWGKKWTFGPHFGRGMPDGFLREYRGVRTRRYTYVRHLEGDWFLYDNDVDPLQRRNLAEEGRQPPDSAREALDAWLQRTRDRFETTRYYMDVIDLETGVCTDPDALTR